MMIRRNAGPGEGNAVRIIYHGNNVLHFFLLEQSPAVWYYFRYEGHGKKLFPETCRKAGSEKNRKGASVRVPHGGESGQKKIYRGAGTLGNENKGH